MKARVKATGEIVYVRPYGSNSSSVLWKDIYRNITYADCELDFEVTNKDEIYNKGWADGWDEAVKSEIPKTHPKLKGSDPDYWTRLEHQAAIAAMGGMCGNTKYNDYAFVDMAKLAIKAAHALVEKYKKEERK